MMDILVLGAGIVGEAVVHDLSQDHKISVADVDKEKLKRFEDGINTYKIDIRDEEETLKLLEGYDLAIGTLPGKLGYRSIELALESGIDMVDVSFMPEDPLDLNEKAEEASSTVIVDAGFGPGMSNVFAGKIAEEIDDLERLKIWLGSLPQDPQPPLHYKLTWSPMDLIEEYTRPARIIVDGDVMEIDPLDELVKNIRISDKEFEGFYSDGLRTLLDTIDVENMEEITLRWEGHLDNFKVLKDLGFFDEDNIDSTIDVISDHMQYESMDFSIMDVVGEGLKEGKEERIRYFFYDEEKEDSLSSIARTTGYSTAAMTRLLIDEDLRDGVIPPEEFGRKKEHFDFLIQYLNNKGIEIKKEGTYSF